MTNPTDIVKQYNEAFSRKDLETVRSLLHDRFTFQGPLMQFNGADEFVGMMKQCGFVCHHENVTTVAEGERVAQIFDWICEAPVQANLRMSECMTLKDGKIFSAELFYDSAKFPSETMQALSE